MLLTRRGALGALSVVTLTALTVCGRDAGGWLRSRAHQAR